MVAPISKSEIINQREFNAGDPIAYFLTWTVYGTWLPGDDRGWNKKGEGEIQESNPLCEETSEARMSEASFFLTEPDRNDVQDTIRKHCGIRGWKLHAVNARSNHVHVVVTAAGYRPETVRDQFKAWCTRRLKQSYRGRQKFWTEGASCRWINVEDDLDAAIQYTLEAQDRKGLEPV